ncbi:hypothetical protein BU23DRAFT_663013 [Bimuria novae-zelandiae CBS 107.79]|uniref:Uncharacterized protein n=1 Tax=Bimuria novae-zelandiae CBS 107.79 TaxID=1447943 RepID=A0A6A5UU71_9PLEO|nr:hypothetical protein BU23DRAFT_663013 [Bimuria novae-zelandiae CBS 107.79]
MLSNRRHLPRSRKSWLSRCLDPPPPGAGPAINEGEGTKPTVPHSMGGASPGEVSPLNV